PHVFVASAAILPLCVFYRFCSQASLHPPDLHSFPTRRSSDLRCWACCATSPPHSRSARCGCSTPTPTPPTPPWCGSSSKPSPPRSEEHTSELQSRFDLVCRLLLEKKKEIKN